MVDTETGKTCSPERYVRDALALIQRFRSEVRSTPARRLSRGA